MPKSDRSAPYDMHDFILDHAQHFIERARYFGRYKDDPGRLAQLSWAYQISEARSGNEWQELIANYPVDPIISDDMTRNDNEDVPVRALLLQKALRRLLEIVEAPETMVADVDRYFACFVPSGASKYADAQKEMITHPGAGDSEISKLSGLNRSTIHKLKKAGVLIQP